jgi:aryl-alcohol dehydrogenase-like predicted oxidoreductase
MIVATKVGMDMPGLGKGLTRAQIERGAEDSLRRLQIDRIDLYYAHEDDPKTPLDESLAAFDRLVRDGKVRAIGASNYTPSGSTPRSPQARRPAVPATNACSRSTT